MSISTRPNSQRPSVSHRLAFIGLLLLALSIACGFGDDYADETIETESQNQIPSDSDSPDAGGTSQVPRFEGETCRHDYAELEVEIDCGTLVVWENRTAASGTLVRLPVVILYSKAEDYALDPLVYLSGGPGEAGVDPESWLGLPFLGDRDMILFDQRGTGNAQPSLNCPELDEIFDEYKAAFDCMTRLQAEGIDLTKYNSETSAADVSELVATLGYESYNLIGISYGTRLALNVMRDHPEGLRAVILDSVFPPQVDGNAEQPKHGWAAMERIFAACAADPDCDETYPDLEVVFLETVTMLDDSPADFDGEDLDGSDFVNAIFQGLYNYDQIPYLPLVIYDTYDGYYDTLIDLQDYNLPYSRTGQDEEDTDSEGMYYSVECREEVPFTTDAALESESSGIPEPVRSALVDAVYQGLDICDLWEAGKADGIENQPVRSGIPTLLFSGEFDPVTPSAWAEAAASYLSNHYNYVIPGVGHSVVDSAICAQEMAVMFLNDPEITPDASCIGTIQSVAFYYP